MLYCRVSANSATFIRAVILVCALVSIAFFENAGWINFFFGFFVCGFRTPSMAKYAGSLILHLILVNCLMVT